MQQVNAQPPNHRHALVQTKGLDDSFHGEILYPVAGVLVVLTLWFWWVFMGADWVRSRVEAGMSVPSIAESHSRPSDKPEAMNAASGPMSGSSNSVAVPHRTASAASDPQSGPTNEKKARVEERFSQLGQTGDLFGGVNALFAAVAMIGVFWAASMQWRSLSEARRATAEQRFETAFFELLRLSREVLERIEVSPSEPEKFLESQGVRGGVKHGASALNALASRYFARFPMGSDEDQRAFWLQKAVDTFKQRVYGQYPSALGPYFRLLYQTFYLVAHSPLDEAQRIRYSNIARGQISEGAVLLLALNGLTWRGRSFVSLIERMGLLEHMHQHYLKAFGPYLRVAYRENAFRGSTERAKHPSEPAPSPGPFAFDKDPSSPDFVITAPMSVSPEAP